MTYQEFKDKYNGKWVDYDGAYGCQCWDLAQKYFTECLGLPASVLGGCGLVSNMLYPPKRYELDKYFDEVPTTEMCAGDVCVWEYGHIALFDIWKDNACWYFSQNPNPCQVMKIQGNGMHAFRLKGSNPKTKYLNLSKNVTSWTVYKTNNYYIPSKTSDVLAKLNPAKFGGLSYKILQDMGNYHFKIKTAQFGEGYIAGNPYKYPCTITESPTYENGCY